MSDLRPSPLTELSYENFRAELLNRVNTLRQSAGKPPVVDDHAANPHLLIIEALALYAEISGATIDNRTLAATLVTARNIEDGTIASESIGYDWEGVASAVVPINMDFGAGGWPQDIILDAGHRFLTDPSYVLDEETTIIAGAPSIDLNLTQVTKQTHNVVSNGQEEQEFTMPIVPAVKGSAAVTVDSVEYRVVDHPFELTAGEEGVAFRVNYKEEGILTTGNGTNGKTIPLGAAIAIIYETSDGSDGRIIANTIEDTVDPILDVLSNPVTVTITQPFGSSGGSDRESLESMQYNGPRSLRTLEASISTEDFRTNAEEVPGVLRALPLTNADDNAIPANVTLVLIASEPSGGGETTLFSDDHNEAVVNPGDWLQLFGIWLQAGGQMYGDSPTALVKLNNHNFQMPVDFRVEARALDLTECGIRLSLESDGNDYLYMKMTYDGGGNTTYKLGQVVGGSAAESSSVEAIDSSVLQEIVVSYTMNEELLLNVGGVDILTFTPNTTFRETKLIPHYEGLISTNQTDWISLVDLPFPNQALVDEVLEYLRTERLTLVSHVVQAGSIQAMPLVLDLDVTPLTGYDITAVRASIITQLEIFLSITKKDENGEFVNQPGVPISLDELYESMRGASGLDRVRIVWPTEFDIVPGPRELIVLGEVRWA